MINSSKEFIETLKARCSIIKKIREFFDNSGYIEVETPLVVPFPSIDAFIDPVEVGNTGYLITSPEMEMKILMGKGVDKIYQITHAFRDGERGKWHSMEFTMLEWYRAGADYIDMMDETFRLISYVSTCTKKQVPPSFERIRIRDIFMNKAGWDPILKWDEERFFRDLVEKIEPSLEVAGGVFLYDFPVQTCPMARASNSHPHVLERFELYLGGIEIANGYTELIDPEIQNSQMVKENERRKKMGKKSYPVNNFFIEALKHGLPQCAGTALGIDRLIAYLLDRDGIRDVITFKEYNEMY